MKRINDTHLSRRMLLRTSMASAAALTLPTERALADPTRWTGQATPVAADREAVFAELGAFIERRMAELKVPGVVVGIVDGDDEYTAGFGVTNVDHPLPVDADTLFQIGSTTKTVTATATMRLVERGDLDLDAPVRQYLPEFRVADEAVSAAVQVRHLLTHTAGWYGDDFTETGDGDDALMRYVEEMADLPQIFPLGEYFSYSNAAVVTLGRVIEAVTGQTYEAAARELVLTPLGMDASFFFAEEIMTESFAVGHTASPVDPLGPPVPFSPWAIPRASNPPGGLISSIGDQVRYARFHLGDGSSEGSPVLRPETMRRMQEPMGPGGTFGASPLDGVGALWLLSTVDGARIVAHGGSTYGQQSAFVLVPERRFGVTVLTNADSGAVLGEEVANWALDRFLGLRQQPPATQIAPPEALTDYVGDYEFAGGEPIVVADGAGALTTSVVGQSLDLAWVGDDTFVTALSGLSLLVDFPRDDAGRVGWIRLSGRMYARVA